MVPRKLCLVMVDALRTDMLERTVAAGAAPNFAGLLERGRLIGDCVSAFPSVTPVCCAEIATGESAERHWISGINWYHRAERRYVEYGSSFEATRAFGLFRTTYDIVYNMNMAHLSPEVETIFESLGDAGVRTACTPFLIFRGRRRHELGLEGMLRRGAVAAGFRHAVWGPDELFYGELFSSRPVPCRPTLARPGTRDEYTACVSRELVRDDAYDFLLFSLPDNDYHGHRAGPEATERSIAHADRCFGELVEACGGLDEFLDAHAVILMADHGQTDVTRPLDLAAELGERWRILEPSSDASAGAEIAISPIARAAAVYILDHRRGAEIHAGVRARLRELDGIDLAAWLADESGRPVIRDGAGSPSVTTPGVRAHVSRRGRELVLRPAEAGGARDRRGRRWQLDGDLGALELAESDGAVDGDRYPDALGRLWAALNAPHAGDLVVSLEPGWECVDWGGAWHTGGGSHGSLGADDSLAPLVLCGFGDDVASRHDQWRLTDVAGLVLEHFGAGAPAANAPALRLAA